MMTNSVASRCGFCKQPMHKSASRALYIQSERHKQTSIHRRKTYCSIRPFNFVEHSCPTIHTQSTRKIAIASTSNTGILTTQTYEDNILLHPLAMKGLYVMYFCACLVERTWRFALPLVLAFVEGGYHAIAVLGFVSPLACSLLGPAVGRALDRMYRPYGLSLTIAFQGIAIVASGMVVLAAANTPGLTLSQGPLFVGLMILSMLERLTAISSELAIERDWVTQLAGKDNSYALARSNAILRRSDLSCELVGSLVFGWLYSNVGVGAAVSAATFLAAALLPMQLYCVYWIANLAPDAMIHGREDTAAAMIKVPWKKLLKPNLSDDGSSTRSFDDKTQPHEEPVKTPLIERIQDQIFHAMDGWKAYFKQPILLSSLTFVILFFNVALSPGGLITAFLTAKGLDGTGMALFRGGCATMGFTGTWVGRRLIQRFGLVNAGQRSLAIQFVFLSMATLVYLGFLTGPMVPMPGGGSSIALIGFSIAVITSRIGMWSFDMVNAQLFQQTVSQREVASASTAEMALCSFSELLMLGLAAYVITPASYSALIYMSFGAVIAANVLFSWWAKRIEDRSESDDDGLLNGVVAVAA